MTDDSSLKRCYDCKQSFPATSEFFCRNKSKKDGLHDACKQCDSARRKAYTQAHREQELANRKMYRDTHKELIHEQKKADREKRKEQIAASKKQWQQGESYKEYQRRYQQEHKQEIASQRSQHYQANRARFLEKQRRYLQTPQGRIVDKTHKQNRKAQKRASNGSYTSQQLQEQMVRQKGKCYYCRKKVGSVWHADHVLPLAKGGSNAIDNIVIACPTCNMRKKDKLLHEWPEGGRLL